MNSRVFEVKYSNIPAICFLMLLSRFLRSRTHRLHRHHGGPCCREQPRRAARQVVSFNSEQNAEANLSVRIEQPFMRTLGRARARSLTPPFAYEGDPTGEEATWSQTLLEKVRDMLRTKEPPIAPGCKRARWTCSCGTEMWDDYMELQPGTVQRLEDSRRQQYGNASTTTSKSTFTNISSLVSGTIQGIWEALGDPYRPKNLSSAASIGTQLYQCRFLQ